MFSDQLPDSSNIVEILSPWFHQQGVNDLKPFVAWLETLQLRSVAAGQHLIQQGDSKQHLFYVDSGLLRLYYTTPDGKERNKSFYAEGAMRGCNTSKYGVPQLRRINPG